jgi:hypothetical protein
MHKSKIAQGGAIENANTKLKKPKAREWVGLVHLLLKVMVRSTLPTKMKKPRARGWVGFAHLQRQRRS